MRVCILVLLFIYTGVLSAEHSIDTAIYDPNGNVKTDQYRSTVLNYDRANQPISITKYILSPSSSTTYHFGYGIADNRIFKGTMSQAYYYLGSHGIYDINADKWEHYPGGVLRLKNGDIQKIVKDHLSNTRAIVGDNSSCFGVISAYDYYPFGKVLRKHENPVSRYQSTDHETDAETGYNDRGARQYDDESFNFNQVDPHTQKYPSLSPYNYVARNPIGAVDYDGKDIIFVIKKGENTEQYRYNQGNFYNLKTDKRYDPSKESVSPTMYILLQTYRTIENSGDKQLLNKLHTLENSQLKHYIYESANKRNFVDGYGIPIVKDNKIKSGSIARFDFSKEVRKDLEKAEGIKFSNGAIVAHEMEHQFDLDQGNSEDNNIENSAKDPHEIRGVKNENRFRKIEGLPLRKTYDGEKIDPKKLEE